MTTFLKTTFISLLVISSITGCKKSILSDDAGDLSTKNVKVKIFSYWNNYLFDKDSLYFVGGAFLKIDDISILHSDYYFVDAGDTLPVSDPYEWKLSVGGDVQLGNLDQGSYSGFYRYKVGLNPKLNAKSPADFPASNPLSRSSLYRGAGKGYNFVTITGRVQDVNKPNSEPNIPLKWVIATDDLAVQYGLGQSFNVVAGKPVTFTVVFNIAKLFTGLNPGLNPIIECDPGKPNDFALANTLQANFKDLAYKLQL